MVRYLVSNMQYGANMRDAASESATKVANLAFATSLALLEDNGTKWKKIKVETGPSAGVTGFVSDKNLVFERTPAVTRLLQSAAHYWDLFDRGSGKEGVPPYKGHVLTMWDQLGGGRPPGDDTSHDDWPWSGAAISAFVRRATGYTNFKLSSGHHTYIKDSVAKREDGDESAPFWGFKLSEKKIELGDLVVQWRGTARTYAFVKSIANTGTTFKSHTDVVCEIRDGYLWALGGNNSHSVSRKKYAITPNGKLEASNNVFMLMKNRLYPPASPSPPPRPTGGRGAPHVL